MPYLTGWLVERQLYYVRTHGVVTTEELLQIVNSIVGETAKIPNRLLHVLVDNTAMESTKVSLRDITTLLRPTPEEALTTGWSVTINPDPVQRMLATVLVQIRGIRDRQFKTAEDALRFLAENSEGLPAFDELMRLYHAGRADMISQIEAQNQLKG